MQTQATSDHLLKIRFPQKTSNDKGHTFENPLSQVATHVIIFMSAFGSWLLGEYSLLCSLKLYYLLQSWYMGREQDKLQQAMAHIHTLREHVSSTFQKIMKSFQSHKALQKWCDVEASNLVSKAGKLVIIYSSCIVLWLLSRCNWIVSTPLYLLCHLHETSEIKNRSINTTWTPASNWLLLT